jgi:hypothetical protein
MASCSGSARVALRTSRARPSALFFVVEHGAQSQFAFEAAKYRFQIRQHDVGTPQFLGIPSGLIAA